MTGHWQQTFQRWYREASVLPLTRRPAPSRTVDYRSAEFWTPARRRRGTPNPPAGLRSVDRSKKSQSDLTAARYADVQLNHVPAPLNRNVVAQPVNAFTLALLNFDDSALDEAPKVAAGRRGRTSESGGKRRHIHRLRGQADHHVAAQIARQHTEDQTDRVCVPDRRPPFLASRCYRNHSFSGQPPPLLPFP